MYWNLERKEAKGEAIAILGNVLSRKANRTLSVQLD